MAECTSGLPATHIASAIVTMKNPMAVPSHHRQDRYATTGNETVQNRRNSRHSGAWAPVTAARARATRPDNRPTSTASADAERTIDRCVDTR